MPVSYYEDGTVTVTQGSPIVTGQGTAFNALHPDGTPNVRPGDTFSRRPGAVQTYKVQSVQSATQFTLQRNYAEVGASTVTYRVVRGSLAVPGDETGVRPPQGPGGPQGNTGTIQIPTTITLPGGSSADMVEISGSTPQNRLYEARIPAGVDGAAWYAGIGAPDPELGVDGDYYIDRTAGATRIYGPKTAGDWGSGFLITGDQGIPGQSGLPINPTTQTAAFMATVGYEWKLDTSAGGFTVTLPANPTEGNRLAFSDVGPAFSGNPPVLDPGASDFAGFTGDTFALNRSRAVYEIAFTSDLGWIVNRVTSAV